MWLCLVPGKTGEVKKKKGKKNTFSTTTTV